MRITATAGLALVRQHLEEQLIEAERELDWWYHEVLVLSAEKRRLLHMEQKPV